MENGSVAKNNGQMKKLFEFAGKYKYLTILSLLLSGISAGLSFVPFLYIFMIVRDVIQVAPNFNEAVNIAYYGWCAVAYATTSVVVYVGSLMCSHHAAFRVARNIRISCVRHIATLAPDITKSIGSGKMRKIIDESSAATETYLAHQLPDMAGAIVTPLMILVILFSFDWLLGLVSLIPIILAFIIMASMLGMKMEKTMEIYNNTLEDMNNEAVEYVRGIAVVKTFGQTVFSFKRFANSINKYKTFVTKHTNAMKKSMVALTVLINGIFAFLIPTVLLVVGRGVGTPEFIMDLIFYIIFTPIIAVLLIKIMFSSQNTMIVKDALKRVKMIMDMSPIEYVDISEKTENDSIEIDNISFKYSGNEKNAIDSISLSIPSGSVVALVGPSGSGKTTMAGLLSRFWDVDTGSIKIGGVDIKKISKVDLYNKIAYVFQDSKLIKASIYDNVLMGRPDASREEVVTALHNAQCDDILEKFPNGIDTVIGTKSVYLSGGECQRVAIARTMLKNASIIILDEATAFADPENEHKVQKAFEQLSNNKTVIMIAHRLSTIKNADCIFVMKDGKIAESGTHNQLVAHNNLYNKMWLEFNSSTDWKVKKEVSK